MHPRFTVVVITATTREVPSWYREFRGTSVAELAEREKRNYLILTWQPIWRRDNRRNGVRSNWFDQAAVPRVGRIVYPAKLGDQLSHGDAADKTPNHPFPPLALQF